MTNDPTAMCNLPRGGPGSISGMEFLRRYHACATFYKQGNESHPLRMAEQADAREWLRARQQPVVAVGVPVIPPRAKRLKKAAPQVGADGRYHL